MIKVMKMILQWIAERFVQESKTKSIEDVAKEYLHDLVDRSLVIINARSYIHGIKTFRVHDLIHNLCQTKCRDGNFFRLNPIIASSSALNSSINTYYRVSTQKESDVTIADGSSISNARSLLYFFEPREDILSDFPFREFRLAQVLDLGSIWRGYNIKHLSSLVHLRHLDVRLVLISNYIPPSICNLWNIGSLILDAGSVHLPKTFWRMKKLRLVKVHQCILKFSDGHEHEANPKLDKVICFSKPVLSTGTDVQRLLQRLLMVWILRCYLINAPVYDEESVDTLDFCRAIQSLKLNQMHTRRQYSINNLLSTLKKLSLEHFQPPWTAISTLAELHCIQVLRLVWISFPESRLEMEDVTFQNLKFFELIYHYLVQWNANTESLPCLKQLYFECSELEELPPCFGEISTLKRIFVR